jgi:hypothetical protein
MVGTEIRMDTDYLTPMAYDCIRIADDATDVLKSELGAACSQYRSEDAYLAGILADVIEIEKDPEKYLDWWNLLEQTDITEFTSKIRVLRRHIEKTIKTPIAERGEPEFKL